MNPRLDLESATGGRRTLELEDVPFHAQLAHHCGPASLLTVLEASGVDAAYEAIADRVYVPGLEGSLQVEMLATARDYGRIAYPLPPDPTALFAEVKAGRPVLVLLNLGVPSAPVWHYAVVIGFDPAAGRVLLRSGDEPRQAQKAGAWLRRWDWAGRWSMVALRPGEWPTAVDDARLLRALADFEDRAPPEATRRAWTAAADHWPRQPLAWLGVGNAAYALGDLAAATDAYRRALEIDPERLAARLNLAVALQEGGDPCAGLAALGSAPGSEHPLAPRYRDLERALRSVCDPAPRPEEPAGKESKNPDILVGIFR